MFSRLKIHTLAFLAAFVGVFMPVVVYAGSFFNNLVSVFVSVISIAFVVMSGGALTPLAYAVIGVNTISIASSAANMANGCSVTTPFGNCSSGNSSQQTVAQSGMGATSQSLSTFSCTDGGPGGIRYDTSGKYTWQVPPNQIEINVEAWGAGYGGESGNGGYATAPIPVTPGENLSLVVGETGGVGHGGRTIGGGGSQASDGGGNAGGGSFVVRGTVNDPVLMTGNFTPLIIAGGGGGNGKDGGYGGHGGGLEGGTGATGGNTGSAYRIGYGGTQTAGGSVGGALYVGGGGGYFAGGGGGGYYGGGVGHGFYQTGSGAYGSAGGGGGSSFIPAGGDTVLGGGARKTKDMTGNGIIVIHWCISDESAYCADGIDNDQDGFIDSADSDCAGGNIETQCANNCSFSSQCSLLSICGGGEKTAFQSGGGGGRNIPMVGTAPGGTLTTNANQCVDGIDNDKDGVFDCKDGECSAESICNQPNFSLFSSDDIFLTFLGTEERSESTFTRISAVAENGFNSDISCGVGSVEVTEFKEDPEGVPDDIIALFTDPVLSLNEYSDGTLFGVSMPTDVPAGTYNIIVECVGGGLNRTVPVRLNASSINPMFYEF